MLEKLEKYIPQWLHLKIESSDELRKLGKNNLERLVSYQEHYINEKENTIKRLKDMAELLKGKSGNDIIELSKQYENPDFSLCDVRTGNNWLRGPEPKRQKDVNRERGETTFNKCGWCEHAGCGTFRYDYMISGPCSLFSYADMENNRERGILTECSLKEMSEKEISKIVKAYKINIKKLEEEIKEKKETISELEKTAKTTEKKPYIAQLRPHDLFNEGDEIVAYIGGIERTTINKPFITSKVIQSYRHHDGCVSLIADEKWHNGEYHKGKGGGWGIRRPGILLRKEFEYLIQNPGFLDFWLEQIEDRNGEYKKFKQTIKEVWPLKFGGKFFGSHNGSLYCFGPCKEEDDFICRFVEMD